MINWFKKAIQKSIGVPNLDPTFFYPSRFSGGGSFPNQIESNPGQNHTWVYAAVTAIINNFIRAYPAIHLASDEKTLDFEHPVIKLMKKPNPDMCGMNFFEAILWNLLLPTNRTPGGQCFIVGSEKDKLGQGEIPLELYVFTDANFYPILDHSKTLIGWELKIPGAGSSIFALDEIIRIRLYNKDDRFRGYAPIMAAMPSVSQDAKATEFNSMFLSNMANPGGIISATSQLDRQQSEDVKKQWKETFSGAPNAGKTLFLPFAMKYDQLSRSHLDFQFMEQLSWNREGILAAYKLNKFSVGIEAGQNRATAYEMDKATWNNAILPFETAIRESLNAEWISHVDKGRIRFTLDKSGIESLKEDRALRIDDAMKLVEMGVPPAAAFDYLELQIDTSEYPWLSENQSTTAKLAFPAEPSQANAPPPKTPPKKMIEVVKALPVPEEEISVTVDELENLSSLFIEKMFTPGEKSIKAPIVQFFIKQRNDFQDQVDRVFASLKDPNTATVLSTLKVSDFLIPKAKQDKAIGNVFKPLYQSIGERVLAITEHEVREGKVTKALDQNAAGRDIAAFLNERLNFISELNDTSFAGVEKRLAAILARSIKENLPPREIAKAIKDGIGSVYKRRLADTLTIARTESAVVANTIRYNVFANLGSPAFHTWLSARDEDVRHNHERENGNTVEVGKRFPVTKLLHPSDPKGPAKEVVNCRCVAILKARGRNA